MVDSNHRHAVLHEKVRYDDSQHDEVGETVCFTRRTNYTLSGSTISVKNGSQFCYSTRSCTWLNQLSMNNTSVDRERISTGWGCFPWERATLCSLGSFHGCEPSNWSPMDDVQTIRCPRPCGQLAFFTSIYIKSTFIFYKIIMLDSVTNFLPKLLNLYVYAD